MPRQWEIEVTGTGLFPSDMLRYDRARFKSDQDEKIANGRGRRYVSLICDNEPTPARWKSFMWHVTESKKL